MNRSDKLLYHLIEGPLMTLLCLILFLIYTAFVQKPAALIIAAVLLSAFFISELYHSVILAWGYLHKKQVRQKVTRVLAETGTENLTLLRCPYLKVQFNDSELGNKIYRVINLPGFELLPDQKIRIDYLEKSRTVLKIELTI